MEITDIFDELLLEAEDGITFKDINIRFHTLEKYTLNSSYDDSIPILIIRNKKEIINKLKQYVELICDIKKIKLTKKNIRECIALLWSNACYEDFSNPSRFIDNHINFCLNNDFLASEKQIGNIRIKTTSESLYKETPFAFKCYINDEHLPSINYGISENVCYIYNIETLNIEQELLSLSLFIEEIHQYGITKIKVVSCLPMRISSNHKELIDHFMKLNYMYNNINITSNPFEKDEYMNIEVEEFENDYLENNLYKHAL